METKFTHRNPNGTFRVPSERLGEFRIMQVGGSIALFGDVINRLGEYEEALTLEEARRYAARKK